MEYHRFLRQFNAKALTRLRIGHSRLTHKHYLLNDDMPECIPCDRPLTVKHILVEFVDTPEMRKQYFNCTDLKTLFNSVAGDTISAFLAEINLVDNLNHLILNCMFVTFFLRDATP